MSEVYDHLNEGLRCYRRRAWFEAHEAWERAWLKQTGATRDLLRGLIQIAAALIKIDEGNARGGRLNFEKAKENLARARSAGPTLLGLDVVRLEREVGLALEADPSSIVAPELPDSSGPTELIYLHGFASSPRSAKAERFRAALGDSAPLTIPDLDAGDFEHLTLSRSIELVRRLIRSRTVLIGSSFGGYVAALVAAIEPRVVGMVLMAPAFDLATRWRQRYGDAWIERWERDGRMLVEHHGTQQSEPLSFEMLADATRHPPLPEIRVPTFILHGRRDDVVPVDLSIRARDQAPDLIQLEIVDDDHALLGDVDRAISATKVMLSRLDPEGGE